MPHRTCITNENALHYPVRFGVDQRGLNGGTVAIENTRLSMSYDSAGHTFAVTDRATPKTVLTAGRSSEAPVARTQSLAVKDAVLARAANSRHVRGWYGFPR